MNFRYHHNELTLKNGLPKLHKDKKNINPFKKEFSINLELIPIMSKWFIDMLMNRTMIREMQGTNVYKVLKHHKTDPILEKICIKKWKKFTKCNKNTKATICTVY